MDDDTGNGAGNGGGTGLPPGLETAWGLRPRPTKGPRPGLSLDRIVDAAVGVAVADGLGAVSMSRVATEVRATAMALYRYVAGKDELLTLMVDAAIGAAPDVPRPEQGWQAGLAEWARALNAAYRRHPWALRVPVSGIPLLPNQLTWMDRGLRCLTGSGLTTDQQFSTILLLSNMVRAYATIEVDLVAAFEARSGTADEIMADFVRTLTMVITPDRFPDLSRALADGTLNQADPPEKEFDFGLERILDGIAALITPPPD